MNKKARSPFVQYIAVAILGVSVLVSFGCDKKPVDPVTPKVENTLPGSIPVAVPSVITPATNQGIAAVSISGARKVTGWHGWPGFPGAPSGK